MLNIAMISGYTPLATFAGNVINNMCVVDFGKLAPTKTLLTVKAESGKTAVVDFDESLVEVDAQYGAVLSLKGSAAITDVAKITGYDYLGQMIYEEITLNGTTAVEGKKAFKYIQHIEIAATGTTNVTVSRSLKLGLPYRTAKVIAETRDGVVSTAGTLVVPVNTAQTATTGDPRGLFDLKTYASAAHVVAVLLVSPEIFEINGKEIGGLFGIPHFA